MAAFATVMWLVSLTVFAVTWLVARRRVGGRRAIGVAFVVCLLLPVFPVIALVWGSLVSSPRPPAHNPWAGTGMY